MSMAIEINELRASFIWMETMLAPLQGTGASSLVHVLAQPTRYAQIVKELSTATGQHHALSDHVSISFPWPQPNRQRFWYNYLERETSLTDLSANRAWKALIPFRWEIPCTLSSTAWPGTLHGEVFLYPHAIALVINVFARDVTWPLTNMVTRLRSLVNREPIQATWEDGSHDEARLSSLVDMMFLRIRRTLHIEQLDYRREHADPFTLVMPLRASGMTNSDQKLSARGAIRRALHALVYWAANEHTSELGKLSDHLVELRNGEPIGHAIYANARGRSLWLPANFSEPQRLNCYHRNLTYASLQVESLSGLVMRTSQLLDQHELLSPSLSNCTRNAAGIIRRMEGKTTSMYHSSSVQRHIEQHKVLAHCAHWFP
jgi:hypothetical protein